MSRPEVPSLRLRMLNAVLRRIVRPRLARTATPQARRAEFDAAARRFLRRPPFLVRHERPACDGAPAMSWIASGTPRRRGVILYLHGGAYFAGTPETHEGVAGRLSGLTGLEAVLPDYARVPEHPAPAAYDDVCAAHAALLRQGYAPHEIVLAGDSAGGGLALALLARLCAEGTRPACAVVFSPWTDLAGGSASLKTNAAADPLLPASRLAEVVDHVIGRGVAALAPSDPRVSPVYATFDAPPPVLIQVGTTEILRDDSLRMAARLRQGGGRVEVSQWPDAPHVWHLFDGFIPEARAALEEAAAFIARTMDGRTGGV